MPQVIFLGSGTSNGVPMLGYRYPDGYLDNPKNRRTRSSILVQGPTGNLLVDATPELRLQCVREGIFDIEATLITHTHADHIMGMDDLRSICIKTGQPMPVYTLPVHQADIRRVFPYAFSEPSPGVAVPRFEFPEMTDRICVGGMEIRTFTVYHGPMPVVGIRINDMAYMTDVNRIPEAAMEAMAGISCLVIDAVRIKPHPNHFNLEQALAAAAEIGAESTYLTHLSHDFDHAITEAQLPPGVRLAFDGLRLQI